MVQEFSTRLLSFLDSVHQEHSYCGLEGIQHTQRGVRSVYRWHKLLGSAIRYFPEVAFTRLGLIHLHLFVEEASPAFTQFPYAVESAHVLRQLGERLLYLHCLVPVGDREAVYGLLGDLQQRGICGKFTCVFTLDGWQGMHPLVDAYDHDGRVLGPFSHDISWQALEKAPVSGADALVVQEYPLAIPVIFEHYGERLSLQQVWLRVHDRMHLGVWKYLPRKQRKWPVNGKTYVKRALSILSETGLFRQNRVWYARLLDNAVEVFLLLKMENIESLLSLVREMEVSTPIIQVYPGYDGTAVVRCVGDVDLLHALIRLIPEEFAGHIQLFFMDRDYSAQHAEPVRFAYELFFDVETKTWCFPREKILQCLGVAHGTA